MKIAICAGGTGGHMFPACALYETMKLRGHEVYMITDERGEKYSKSIEEKIVAKTMRFSWRRIVGFISLVCNHCCLFFKFLRKHDIDMIVGLGGLFTIIPLILGKLFGVKVVIYEQNSICGKANSFLSHIANLKISSFPINDNWRILKSPIRSEFFKKTKLSNDDNKITILVISGSQGAASFMKIIPDAIAMLSKEFRSKIRVCQQTIPEFYDKLSNKYKQLNVDAVLVDFLDDIANRMSESQLVICRSGASTLSELEATGKPAILIPYPFSTDNHQKYNALYYQNKKAAWLVDENHKASEEIYLLLSKILEENKILSQFSSNMYDSLCEYSNIRFAEALEEVAKKS